ncbi:MAG: hypothetical protein AWM53_00577 [Candidatus Dichloromethanomonas elyunquensis]|nr:MAG: hypothetical protein AWM53_00577 [Candidatus Dichloromethanomonas elyunquensis]
MVDLRITQQFGSIGLKINDAQYQLKQIKPNLEIKQVPADLGLETTPPDLKIDYTPMLESLGLGNIAFVASTFTNTVKDEYLANLEKDTQTADQIGAIEKRQSIGDIVFQSQEPEDSEIELVSLSPINITYIPATVKPKVQLGGVNLNLNYGKVSIENFVFPSVRSFMVKEPFLKIDAVGQIFDHSQ